MRRFLCQKKINIICSSVFSVFLSLFLPISTSALSISPKNESKFGTASRITGLVDGSNGTFDLSSSGFNQNTIYGSTVYADTYEVRYLDLRTSFNEGPTANQEANIFKFSVSFTFAGSNLSKPYRYNAYPAQDYSDTRQNVQVLNYNCSESELHGVSDQYTLLCDFTVFANTTFSKLSIYFPVWASNNSGTPVTVVATASNYVRYLVNFDSLTNNDKDWLSGDFADAIGEAVKNAQEEANEEVKTETQTQVNSSSSTSNTQGSEAQTEGMSLLSVFSNFVSVLTTATPTDTCNIALDFSGYTSDFNVVVDLCSLNFPQELQFIGTLVIIMFVVPLTVATVKRMVNLFKSFTG